MSETPAKPFEGLPPPIYYSSKTGEPLGSKVIREGTTPQGTPYRVYGPGGPVEHPTNSGIPSMKIYRGRQAINEALAVRQPQQKAEIRPSEPTTAELQERLTTLGVEPIDTAISSPTTATNK